jgi:hypothetical protein
MKGCEQTAVNGTMQIRRFDGGASLFSAAVSAGLIGLLASELDIQIGSEYIRGVSRGIKTRRAPSK